MRLIFVSVMTALIALPLAAQDRGAGRGGRGGGNAGGAAAAAPAAMTMTIAGFPDGGQIPVKFSQAAPGAAPGEGTSPAISWANRCGRSAREAVSVRASAMRTRRSSPPG